MPLEITQESRTFRLTQQLIQQSHTGPEAVANEGEMLPLMDPIQSKCLVTMSHHEADVLTGKRNLNELSHINLYSIHLDMILTHSFFESISLVCFEVCDLSLALGDDIDMHYL
jgi:hypothetical protein